MLYLGTPSGPDVKAAMRAGLIGCMTAPANKNRVPDGALYACDNSKFGSDGKGSNWPGLVAWFDFLTATVERFGADRCLFAVAPDVPFDSEATFAESRPWLGKIRSVGVPAAFAAQDGCENGLVPWDDFDVLFLAGSTEWKEGQVAEQLSREAHARGKAVHMGRVNSRRRLHIAEWFGCETADGTHLAHGPDRNLPQLLRWLAQIRDTPSLLGALADTSATGTPALPRLENTQ